MHEILLWARLQVEVTQMVAGLPGSRASPFLMIIVSDNKTRARGDHPVPSLFLFRQLA
jgi:hypothetical protein